MAEPESSETARSRLSSPIDGTLRDSGSESNLAELTALFAAHNGGNLSADLALEIVLHEIVEQACLAMGATGAAIVVERDGELVCRASSGSTAPELGSRLDQDSGISGECIRTRRAQWCDDAQNDPRVDVEASRRLGVRSIMVLPLLHNRELAGIFEVFSTRTSAFGDRDLRTLEALALRVMKNLEPPIDLPGSASGARPAAPFVISSPAAAMSPESLGANPEEETVTQPRPGTELRRVEALTWVLAAAVVACAVLLGVLFVKRLGGRINSAAVATTVSTNARGTRHEPPAGVAGIKASGEGPASPGLETGSSHSEEKKATGGPGVVPGSRKSEGPNSFPPDGGLQVYEDGKVVFRLPSSAGKAEPIGGAGVQQASSVDSEGIVELSPEAAKGILTYRVEPVYPDEARQQNIEGVVVLGVHINRDGAVQDLKLLSGNPLLAQAALQAVKQWQFKPRLVNGGAVEMQTRVTLIFRLRP